MPARLGDLLEGATEHIVLVEDAVPCGWFTQGVRCPVPAAWDLLVVCDGGHETTEHACTKHKDRVVTANDGVGRCPHHGGARVLARIVAVYPRRTS